MLLGILVYKEAFPLAWLVIALPFWTLESIWHGFSGEYWPFVKLHHLGGVCAWREGAGCVCGFQ